MTPERLREIYGAPHTLAAAKVISKFDHHCRQFIDNSSFLVLATSDGQNLDVSPKGDPAGFVAVESDTTLLLPDRPGNNRIDSLLNILAHPKVALLFMIPSVTKPCVSTARQRSAKTLPCVTSSRSTGAVQNGSARHGGRDLHPLRQGTLAVGPLEARNMAVGAACADIVRYAQRPHGSAS